MKTLTGAHLTGYSAEGEISNTSSQSDLHKQLKTNPSRLYHPQTYFSETQRIKQPLHSELFNKHRQGQETH